MPTATAFSEDLRSPPIPEQAVGPDRASAESEFQMRLEAYHERTRKQSFARRCLIHALSRLAQVALGMAIRLDT